MNPAIAPQLIAAATALLRLLAQLVKAAIVVAALATTSWSLGQFYPSWNQSPAARLIEQLADVELAAIGWLTQWADDAPKVRLPHLSAPADLPDSVSLTTHSALMESSAR